MYARACAQPRSCAAAAQWLRARACRSQEKVDAGLLEMMKSGSYFYKHDFGRNKRGRKFLKLSNDGLSLKWKSVGQNEVVAGSESERGSPSARGILRSASFSRSTSSE